MKKYINQINDKFILNFLKTEINQNYYQNFIINRNHGGITVNFENLHGDKYGLIFTDFYVRTLYKKFEFLEKEWRIALTKLFKYDYFKDLKEEISEEIKKRHTQELNSMKKHLNEIKEQSEEYPVQLQWDFGR